MKDHWIKWRKLNTVTATYLSTYPAEVWKICRFEGASGKGWKVFWAANDGDPYLELVRVSTLAQAKDYACRWVPGEGKV